MAEVKLTKNELRAQQVRLGQLQKYLPTLQLKKAMLQLEVNEARVEIKALEKTFQYRRAQAEECSAMVADQTSVDPVRLTTVKKVHKDWENIAGVELPIYKGTDFEEVDYSLFDSPPWLDAAVSQFRKMIAGMMELKVGQEKLQALEEELREVSIRVNLFEKILIPRATANIKKIRVFLGDQQLASVAQAKVAKTKIEMRKKEAAMAAQEGAS